MNKNLTELVFIIDRSGSMAGLESDTIGGFNATLKAHQNAEGEAFVSTVLFDHESTVLHDRLPIASVSAMTETDYQVRGCTALLDALRDTIKHIGDIHKYLPNEHTPARTIFVITTDGLENASHKYTYEQIQKLISQKEEIGWDFLFLGANIDAAAEASRIGINPLRAATYVSDNKGTEVMYDALCAETVCMRAGQSAHDGSWKKQIDKDLTRIRQEK